MTAIEPQPTATHPRPAPSSPGKGGQTGLPTPKTKRSRPRWWVPEVIQTSAMDCGPAALKALLEGFGIQVSYGRLREACQTELDGTSIDTLEEVANALGLAVDQVVVPPDHLLLAETGLLPALIVVRLATGLTHFVVAWRQLGGRLQVMDPGSGRVWKNARQFLEELYIHTMPVGAAEWREWAGSEDFLVGLRSRLTRVGLTKAGRAELVNEALGDAGWHTIAALDAVTRMMDSLVRSGGIKRGAEATRVLVEFFEQVRREASEELSATIPAHYWSARALPMERQASEQPQVLLRGAVLLKIRATQAAIEEVKSAKKSETSEADDISPATKPGESELSAPKELDEISVAGPNGLVGRTELAVEEAPGGKQSSSEEKVPFEEEPISPDLMAALEEPPARPSLELWRLLRADGLLTPLAMVVTLLVVAATNVVEALLLRGLIDLSNFLPGSGPQGVAVLVVIIFLILALLLEVTGTVGLLRMGRRLEGRLRMALLEKIPRIPDRYFQSRPVSDMAERAHSLYQVRALSSMGGRLVGVAFEIVLTTLGLILLDPASAPLALLLGAYGLSLPLVLNPILLQEPELKIRTHNGALSRFYLDGLLGLMAIRTHRAERAFRHEHEKLLTEWNRASFGMLWIKTLIDALQFLGGYALIGWLVFDHLGHPGSLGSSLLFLYWAFNIYAGALIMAPLVRQYPTYRNITLRLLEPLTTPTQVPNGTPATDPTIDSTTDNRTISSLTDTNQTTSGPTTTALGVDPFRAIAASAENGAKEGSPCSTAATPLTATTTTEKASLGSNPKGVAIAFEGVSVRAGGHTILEEISFEVTPGSHVVIVGPSGAGKSSLVGLLLGWHQPVTGQVWVDGAPLDQAHLESLRQEMAWVDPAIQLWNRSLLANLRYGHSAGHRAGNGAGQSARNSSIHLVHPGQPPSQMAGTRPRAASLNEVIDQADLLSVLERLPNGLQTLLGEGGGLVSGGEGQRVRLGRALLQPGARLVILDEPFRGLDREKRRQLLRAARQWWQEATLLCITHDLSETGEFDRVLVLEGGRLVEDAPPTELNAQADSRYRALVQAEAKVRVGIWGNTLWRRLWVEGGQVVERPEQL